MAKHYDKEFKLNALQYRKDHPELNVAAVCRNLGITAASYYKWAKEFETTNTIEVRGSGNYSSDLEKENARLKRELQSKEDALRILKKLSACLKRRTQIIYQLVKEEKHRILSFQGAGNIRCFKIRIL